MKDKRKAYEEKVDAQLRGMEAQLALMKAKADNLKADAKIDYYKTIDALKDKHAEASAKLHELKSASDNAWEEIKKGAEKAWDEVKSTFHNSASKFK